jgi:hypothetical protein
MIIERLIAALVFHLSRFSMISEKIRYAGEVADFSNFIKVNFGKVEFRLKRENIWRDIEKHLQKNVTFIELGVASGYLTAWWLSPLRKSLTTISFSYHGFDSFHGLPNSWRNFKSGTFSTNGMAPAIVNENLFFHVGLVEVKLNAALLEKILTANQKVIFFDLDLFDPSFHAYSTIKPFLKNKDILYFDEARDSDERRLLEMHIMKDFLLTPISASYSNIAFSIKGSIN